MWCSLTGTFIFTSEKSDDHDEINDLNVKLAKRLEYVMNVTRHRGRGCAKGPLLLEQLRCLNVCEKVNSRSDGGVQLG